MSGSTVSTLSQSDVTISSSANTTITVNGSGDKLLMSDGDTVVILSEETGDRVVLNGGIMFLHDNISISVLNGSDDTLNAGINDTLNVNGTSNILEMGSGDVVGLLSNASNNEVLLQNGGLLELQNVIGTDFFGSNNVVNAQAGDTINVAGNSNVLEMANGDEVGFFGSGAGNEVLLTNGSIWMVGSVTGSNFFGSGDIVTTNSFDSLSLYGSSNDVNAGDNNSINLSGSLNTANFGRNGYANVSGSNDSVNMTDGVVDMLNGVTGFILAGSNDTLNAGTGSAGGSGDSINIVGSADTMNMTNGGYVGILSGSNDSVNMTDGVVDMLNGVTGFILAGSNDTLNAGTGSSGGSGDVVSVDGNGNAINMANGGNVQIVSGSGNDQVHMSGGTIGVQSSVTGVGIFGSGNVVSGASSDTVEVIGNNNSLTFAAGSYVQVDAGDAGTQINLSGGTIGVASNVANLAITGSGLQFIGGSNDAENLSGSNNNVTMGNSGYIGILVGSNNVVNVNGGTVIALSNVTGTTLFGSGDNAGIGVGSSIDVSGNNNAVDSSNAGTADFVSGTNDTANMTNGNIFVGSGVTGMIVNGAGNIIEALEGSSTNINGNANTITAAAGSYVGIVGGGNVAVSMSSGSLDTFSDIAAATLTGSFDVVGLGSGNQFVLNGNDNTVDASSGETIYLSSADNGDTLNISNGTVVVQPGVSNIEVNGTGNNVLGVSFAAVSYIPGNVSSIAAYFNANPNLNQTQIKVAESDPNFQSNLASYLTSVNIQAMPANTIAMLEGYSNVYLAVLGIPASVIAQAAYIDQQFAWAETQAPIMTDGLQQALQNLVPALLDSNTISKSMMLLASGLIANAHNMSVPYNAQHPADTISQDFTAAKLAIQIAEQPDNAKTGLSEMFQLSDMNVPLNLVVTPGAPPGIGPGLQFFAKAENGTWFHQFLGVIDSYVTPIVDIAAIVSQQPEIALAASALNVVQAGQDFASGNDLQGILSALGAVGGGLGALSKIGLITNFTNIANELNQVTAIAQGIDGVVAGAQDGQFLSAFSSALGGLAGGAGLAGSSGTQQFALIGAGLASAAQGIKQGTILSSLVALTESAQASGLGPTIEQDVKSLWQGFTEFLNGVPSNVIVSIAGDGAAYVPQPPAIVTPTTTTSYNLPGTQTQDGMSIFSSTEVSNTEITNGLNALNNAIGSSSIFFVGGHGYYEGISPVSTQGGALYNAADLANAILNQPGYQVGEAVQLYSCNTGGAPPFSFETNIAQQLANLLDATVIAPNGYIDINSNGAYFINKMETPPSSNIPNNAPAGLYAPLMGGVNASTAGSWKTFLPNPIGGDI